MKLIIALLALSITACIPKPVHAQDYSTVSELAMKTDAGEVVITTKECKVQNKVGFEYEAYATDGAVVHKGCWKKEGPIVHIWFYQENPQIVASYGDYYFTPKPTL